MVPVGADVGTQPQHLVDEHEPGVEDVLGHHRRPVGHRGQRDRHRQHVGREPGIGQRDDIDGLGPVFHPHPEAARRGACRGAALPDSGVACRRVEQVDLGTALGELVQRDLQVRGLAAAHGHVPAGDGRGERPGARDDPVRNHPVLHRPELVHALDVQARSARTGDPRPHRGEHAADVDDVGLARGVVDHRGALGQYGGHQQVLGGADAGEVQPDRRAVQPVGPGDHEAVLVGDLRTHPDQAGDVVVQAARPDRVTARVGDPHLTAPGQQRPEHVDRRTHAADQVVVGLGAGLGRDVDRERVVGQRHLAAEPAQHFAHDRHVEDARHVREHRPSLDQQRRGHQLQDAVLRAADSHLADESGTAVHPEELHRAILRTAPDPPRPTRRPTIRPAATTVG